MVKNLYKMGMVKGMERGQVIVKTIMGANRALLPLSGIQTQRIC